MSERRYDDAEVQEILRLATTGRSGEHALPADSSGLTLTELQRIAEEAGIAPALVARAAHGLDARGSREPSRRLLGLPIGLARTLELPRAPTEREWQRMIAGFRAVFGVQGVVRDAGRLREWVHGDLHVSLEPTARGERLRLTHLKSDAIALNGLAVMLAAFSAIMGGVVMLAGKPEKAVAVIAAFGGMALVTFVANLVRLPSWAHERDRQMEEAAAQVVRLLSEGPPREPTER